MKTALAASVKKGRANGDEKVTLVTEKDDPIGATLSLREKVGGALIKLTGDSAVKEYFCSDVNAVAGVTRSCTLIPETEVFLSGPFGQALASLRFMVDYP
ncbi:hypothetical protein [Salmonella enterica]|uniref:hypothetical protein n=1 Tax=Salmonella enterica TaxID=28901 RepID=UPI0026DD99AA|nr:hypothetical protein [Salmonella enterica]MDO3872084.1 hypothetical protein [Salmonella enterica]MDO3886848.1 hypothetical protein [Salmonella enterica]MDO3900041.1 hypothetical protein [Salmonella enterica]MDO3976209.1 hypothetical protein [Salmonella enterica]